MKNDYLKELDRFVFLMWMGIWLLLWMQFSEDTSIERAFLFSLMYVLMIYPFATYLSTHLLQKAVQSKRFVRFSIQFALCTLAVAGLTLAYFCLFDYLEQIGLFPESQLFENGITAMGSLFTTLLILFGFCGLRFFEEILKMEKILMESQLQTLQAQITPHFMFNVLNHVNVLIKKEPDLASELLVQYTDILRYQLYGAKKEYTSLREEVDFLMKFIDIEKVRWRNSLGVECTWDIEDEEVRLPPLLLITFVENAFKHVSRSKLEKGYVKIALQQDAGEIRFYVENSKFADTGRTLDKDASGIGLENIKRRLDILFPDKYELLMNEAATVYSTTLTIKI